MLVVKPMKRNIHGRYVVINTLVWFRLSRFVAKMRAFQKLTRTEEDFFAEKVHSNVTILFGQRGSIDYTV